MTISNIARSHLLVPLCTIVGVWMGEAMAGTSECYAIKDGDNRSQCLAEIKGSRDRCYAIKDQDNRKACLARTR